MRGASLSAVAEQANWLGQIETRRMGVSVRFDVYGRFELEVVKEKGVWIAYRIALGTRVRENALVFPEVIEASELVTYIDDVFHELSGPGQSVRVIA